MAKTKEIQIMNKKLLCPMLALMTLFLTSCGSTDLKDVLGALESGDQALTLQTIVAGLGDRLMGSGLKVLSFACQE